jgi:hypothetical protein
MADRRAFSPSLGAVLGFWSALGCAGQSAAPRSTLATPAEPLGRASLLRPAKTATQERDATVSEILRGYTARKAALARAQVENLAAIDLGGAPCSWKAIIERTAWTVPIPFRSRSTEPPFVRFSSGVLAVEFAQGAPTAANVMSEGGGIVLHAFADVHDLQFYPSHTLTLDGFVRLHASAQLSVSRVHDTQLDFSYPLSDTIGLTVEPARVTAHVPCSAVALVEQPDGFAPRDKRCSADSVLLEAAFVPLTATPGGRVVARLAVESYAAVEILERRAGHVRVEIARDDHTLFGWVPLRAVNHDDDLGYLACHGTGQLRDSPTWSVNATARCSIDLPLSVEQGSKRSPVGMIRAQTTFKIVARQRDTVSVDFYQDAGLLPEPNTTFVIDATALTSCRVRTPPRLSERPSLSVNQATSRQSQPQNQP